MFKIPNLICNNYKCDIYNLHVPLITTSMSICANNITIIMSRKEGAKKYSLQMMKTAKKQDKHINLTKTKND